jgi:hypothetical protein
MASNFIGGSLPRGRNTLDVPVAALAGLSVAFVTFAAPADLLAEMVASSGLSAFIPSAEPPLGMNARLAIGAGAAVLVFALAFLLLRWLDRFGSRRPEAEPEPEVAAPRLRRRDFHPDAAPRPPLSAAAELGEPEEDLLDLAHAPGADALYEPEPGPEPEPEPATAVRPSWLPEEFQPAIEEAAPAMPEPRPQPARSRQDDSLSELLDRLEQGLARRRADSGASTVSSVPMRKAPATQPQVFPEAGDDRLQSAINSLQRLAARRD